MANRILKGPPGGGVVWRLDTTATAASALLIGLPSARRKVGTWGLYIVTNASVFSLVPKGLIRTSTPTAAAALENLVYQEADTGTVIAGGTALTTGGKTKYVRCDVHNLYLDYTHTSGTGIDVHLFAVEG